MYDSVANIDQDDVSDNQEHYQREPDHLTSPRVRPGSQGPNATPAVTSASDSKSGAWVTLAGAHLTPDSYATPPIEQPSGKQVAHIVQYYPRDPLAAQEKGMYGANGRRGSGQMPQPDSIPSASDSQTLVQGISESPSCTQQTAILVAGNRMPCSTQSSPPYHCTHSRCANKGKKWNTQGELK